METESNVQVGNRGSPEISLGMSQFKYQLKASVRLESKSAWNTLRKGFKEMKLDSRQVIKYVKKKSRGNSDKGDVVEEISINPDRDECVQQVTGSHTSLRSPSRVPTVPSTPKHEENNTRVSWATVSNTRSSNDNNTTSSLSNALSTPYHGNGRMSQNSKRKSKPSSSNKNDIVLLDSDCEFE